VKIPSSILRYWLAMNATAFDAAVASVMSYGGVATFHTAAAELGSNVPALTLQQLVLIFISSFGWAILQYLHAHPLQNLLPQ
jgi:hypothetical protein